MTTRDIAKWFPKLSPDKQKKHIDGLKKSARKYYLEYRYEFDAYNCGTNLATYLSPHMRECAKLFNWCMDELAKIDPKTPKTRL